MKKVLLATMALAMVAALVGIGVYAEFTDVEKSTQNRFTAGTLNLTVDGKEGAQVPVYITENNLKPGDSGNVSMTLANVGSVDGVAKFSVDVTTEIPGKDGVADLAGKIKVTVKYNDVTKINNLILNTITETELGSLVANGTGDVVVEWSLPTDVGNEVQGDGIVFDLVFKLDQA